MPVLEDNIKEQVKDMFKDLRESVKLIVFSQESPISMPGKDCVTCKDNRMLIEEVAALSDKITVEVYDFIKDKKKAEEYRVDKIPATVVQGEKDAGIRIYGVPAGYEFPTLLSAIKLVSEKNSGLSNESKEKVKDLAKPVHIQVFVTSSCPYCASAATLAHKLAYESDQIKADVVNAQEFPHLAQRYNVLAVPKTVVNDTVQFEGALPEQGFLEKTLQTQEQG